MRRYLRFAIQGVSLVRQPGIPAHENPRKRQVKSPKIYLRDSGVLHALLGLASEREILSHPKLGASFEGIDHRARPFDSSTRMRRIPLVEQSCVVRRARFACSWCVASAMEPRSSSRNLSARLLVNAGRRCEDGPSSA